MRVTQIVFCIFLLLPISLPAQDQIKFEQLAFDFYRDSLATEKKYTLWVELESEKYYFWYPRCLNEFKLDDGDTIITNLSKQEYINPKGDRRYKVRERPKGKYPRVYCTISFGKSTDQQVVTIVEIYKYSGVTYHIYMDKNGQIIDWCDSGWIN